MCSFTIMYLSDDVLRTTPPAAHMVYVTPTRIIRVHAGTYGKTASMVAIRAQLADVEERVWCNIVLL